MTGSASSECTRAKVARIVRAPNITLAEFKYVRENLDVDFGELRQAWVLRAIQNDDEVYRWYRLLEDPEKMEGEIVTWANSFDEISHVNEISHVKYRESALRWVRRFLLSRFAFGAVRAIDVKIRESNDKHAPWWHYRTNASRLWLWKDYLLPRVGLSLLIGYGLMLGAGQTLWWLSQISMDPRFTYFGLLMSEILLMITLVYLTIRENVGANSARVLLRRTLGVGAGCLVWAVVSIGLQHLLCFGMGWSTTFSQDALTAATALLIAIVGQFFFSENSMSEPL